MVEQKEIHRKLLEEIVTKEDLHQQSEILRREVLNNALDAFIGMDQNGLIFEWNNQAEVLFERKREDAIGLRLAEIIIPSRYYSAHESGVKHFLETGEGSILNKRVEFSALRRNGSEFPIELTITPVKVNGIYVFFAFLRDISGRKLAETERENLLAQEKSARKFAEMAVSARDEFLLIASHELKTPLTSLMLQAHMIKKYFDQISNKNPAEEREMKHLSALQVQLDRLSVLIDKLLDVSRVSAGKLKLEITVIDLSALVREIVVFLQEELMKAGYHLEVHADQPIIGLWDRTRIEQIITNLLTNAMKYGNGKPIVIKVESDNIKAILIIEDHGIGIAKDDQVKLFEKFERFASPDHYAGMGLGLYITRQIIEAHGGTINVESELGHGSTFIVKLPLIFGTNLRIENSSIKEEYIFNR